MSTPDDITQLITNSGNSFHAKVARALSAAGWHVVISPYYMDQTQSKAREIDLIAEKLWPVSDHFGRPVANLAVRLFVECKFVPTASVFWFTDKDRSAAEALVTSARLFPQNNTYTQKHHYLSHSSRVAKLFTTSGPKGQESDPFYKALNQSLNALVAMRGKSITVPKESPHHEHRIKAILEFPVIVCSSLTQAYAVDFYSDGAAEPITDNFQFEVRYAYIDRQGGHKDEFFLLDFVDFSKLDGFLSCIDEDAKTAAFLAS
jgi:hypothetical protein